MLHAASRPVVLPCSRRPPLASASCQCWQCCMLPCSPAPRAWFDQGMHHLATCGSLQDAAAPGSMQDAACHSATTAPLSPRSPLASPRAGYYLAVTKLNDPSSFSTIGSVHPKLGLAIVVLSCLQTITGLLFRPSPDHRLRGTWRLSHSVMGHVLVLSSWVNVILGIILFSKKFAEPLYRWLVPVVATMVLLLLINAVMVGCNERADRRSIRAQHTVDPENLNPLLSLPSIKTKAPSSVSTTAPLLAASHVGGGLLIRRDPIHAPLLADGHERSDSGMPIIGATGLRPGERIQRTLRDRQHRRSTTSQAAQAAAEMTGSPMAPPSTITNMTANNNATKTMVYGANPLYEFAPAHQFMTASGSGPAGYGARDQRDNPVYSPPSSGHIHGSAAGTSAPPVTRSTAGTAASVHQANSYQHQLAQLAASGNYRPRTREQLTELADALASQRRAAKRTESRSSAGGAR
jgi:hypothetical protein